jgi:dolichyl-phosphate-mannose--protein O-mannosyl transferase
MSFCNKVELRLYYFLGGNVIYWFFLVAALALFISFMVNLFVVAVFAEAFHGSTDAASLKLAVSCHFFISLSVEKCRMHCVGVGEGVLWCG